jgi:ureidoglycolate dehydrogenase (NAD+)
MSTFENVVSTNAVTTETAEKSISASGLQAWVGELFESMGVDPESAAVTADSLVDADLRGIGTHGVIRVPIYAKRLQLGLINATPRARFTSVGAAAEVLDGDNGLGQWVGMRAMQRACELAQTNGVGFVTVRHSNHFGTAGWFARIAAESNCAALIWSQGESLVVPFGGTQRFFGTNPFCMSVPRTGEEPIVLDMATSAVPFGKIEVAKVTTGSIPTDWAVDAEGRPTTDPHQVHALQPMAGPKGSGLAMLVDLLSGALTGSACGPRINRMYDDFEHEHNLAHSFLAIKADAFASGSNSTQDVIAEMVGDLRTQRPADGFDEVLLPGEIEACRAEQNEAGGVVLPPHLISDLQALGATYGREFPL